MDIFRIASRTCFGTVILKTSSYMTGNKVSLASAAAISVLSLSIQELALSCFKLNRTPLEQGISFLVGSTIAVVVVGSFTNLSPSHLAYLHILPVINVTIALVKAVLCWCLANWLGCYIFDGFDISRFSRNEG